MNLFTKKHRRNQKGIAMVIAMIFITVLTAVGVLALNSTRFELLTAGHLKQSMQTQYIAESSVVMGIQIFASSYDAYERLKQQQEAQGNDYKINIHLEDIEASNVNVYNYDSFGFTTLQPGFEVSIDRPIESPTVTGYSLPGSNTPHFCFKRFRFSGTGQITSPNDTLLYSSSECGYRAFVNIGPVECSQ